MQATTIYSLSWTALISLALTYLFVFSPFLFLCSFFLKKENGFQVGNNLKSLLHCTEKNDSPYSTPFPLSCSELELCMFSYFRLISKLVLPNCEKFPGSSLWFYVVLLYCLLIKVWLWSERFYKMVSEEKKITKTKVGESVKERGIKLVPLNFI